MSSYFLLVFLVLSIASCQNPQTETAEKNVKENINSDIVSSSEENKSDEPELIESFSDDKKVGTPRKNKIEILQFKKKESDFVGIKFYSLEKNKEWKLKQNFELIKYGELSCHPQIKDFNNDGFKDVTYVSDIAARGANEIRNLLVYDKKKDELIFIKNSGNYPNLSYNKELNCISALSVYGGYSTKFMKIDGDVLKEFARVETFGDVRKVYLIDENGKEKLLRKDKVNENEGFFRYKNFNPPEPSRFKEFN